MAFSGYPKVVNLDYLPPEDIMEYTDQFDGSYLGHGYTTNADYPLNSFLDSESFFDRPLTSVEMTSGYPSKPGGIFSPTLPATGNSMTNSNPAFRPTFDSTPFGQFEEYPSGFSLNPTSLEANGPTCFSPETQTSSRTPSLCGDAPPPPPQQQQQQQQQQLVHSPSLSPHILKREFLSSPASISLEITSKRPQRKRGRPCLDRSSANPQSPASSVSATKCQRIGRLPHNQVERKYREGLNSELERLRRAVPTLPQRDEGGGVMGQQPKPSKAMVLSSAIEYIGTIEKERDALKIENERLRRTAQRRGGLVVPDDGDDDGDDVVVKKEQQVIGGDETLNEFLMNSS